MSPRITIYLLLLLAVGLLGAAKFKKLTAPFKLLTVIIFVTLVSELACRYLAKTIRNSNPPYPFFICLEYIGFILIYQYLFQSVKLKKLLVLSIPPFMLLCILNTLLFQNLLVFPSNILLVEHTLLVIVALLLFYQLANQLKNSYGLDQDVFWLNNAIIFYYSTDFIVRGVYNYCLQRNLSLDLNGWINYSLNLLFYLLLGAALWLNYKKSAVTWKA